MTDVDVVVIGSGAGGMAAAVALANAGEKVLVLEQHTLPGGWCHSFELGGYHFSPGVHYIGDLGEGGRLRATYEGLGVADDLVFHELDPEGFDRVHVGDVRFDIPRGRERFIERLSSRFPHQAAGIRLFLEEMQQLSDDLAGGMRLRGPVDVLALPARVPTLLRRGMRTVAHELDRCGVTDPVVRAILTVQAGDHGMPPSRAAAALHAAVMGHYFDGAWYPRGGGRALPKAFIKALRRAGGNIETGTSVAEILLEGREVRGVRLADGTEIRCDTVVSNADPRVTWGRLVPEDAVPRRVRWRMRRTKWSLSAISLFLAAELDPAEHGLTSANLWSLSSPDVEGTYTWADDPAPLSRGPVPGAFLTCTTCKDPTKRRDGIATMEAFTFVSYDAFARWAGTSHQQRPEDYTVLKEAIADRVLGHLEQRVPGLRDRLVFREVGTPLTNDFYVAGHRGNLYGIEKSRTQIGPLGFSITSPIAGLYQCGASTLGHGVAGATFSGLAAARAVLGCGTRELLSRGQGQHLRTVPADHPERWPDDLKPKRRVA